MASVGQAQPSARADLRQGLAWMALGVAVLVGSVTMDRLERQNVNPYTVPGLLPGLLGIALIALGGILALRSARRGALHEAAAEPRADQREQRRRVLVVLGLCLGYAVLLVGHGLPFWLASAIYVTGSVLILDYMGREQVTESSIRFSPLARLHWRRIELSPSAAKRVNALRVLKALVIGLGSGVITQWVFQSLFLVRLP